MQRCLDAITWEQVLWLYVHHNIQGVDAAQPIVDVCGAMAANGHATLTPTQRIHLLHFLITETLGSEYPRKLILDNANNLEERDRKMREEQLALKQSERHFLSTTKSLIGPMSIGRPSTALQYTSSSSSSSSNKNSSSLSSGSSTASASAADKKPSWRDKKAQKEAALALSLAQGTSKYQNLRSNPFLVHI